MARTRKRDDDSQYNSDTTSLAALDASSMSAAGSRSSLTFASSTKALKGKQRRPTKRRRKSLTDALQSISLDKDKGVPQQILSSKTGDFPFSNNSKNVALATNGSSNGVFSCPPNFNSINSRQQANRQIDRVSSGAEGDGDIYYDDDNSQLTSSSDEPDEVENGMEDDFDDDEEEEDDDSLRKRLAIMTAFEKAQRQVMLKLVFGKDHKESMKQKTKLNLPSSGPREVSSCVRIPSGLIVDPVQKPPSLPLLSIPPFATVSTTMKAAITTSLSTPNAEPAIPPKDDNDKDKNEECKDPVDRKIEELLRRSLKNVKEGSHPLRLTSKEDSDSFVSTPWKTQDDMAIDPQIYSPRIQTTATSKTQKTNDSMALDTMPSDAQMAKIQNTNSQPQNLPFGRQRSNSLPGGLDMTDATTVAMDMDG
eukprot:CAMPEP_0116154700 /NCGR_PEP_ID=MMETSP0329-20121206/21921_1 /TAXON_ID=697910 /ORGANISM="Pseudo-nitzschia arenysensis, Strain B593" /LENGTH=420 /DNA_ID=CAMNT_0003651699 /DNA_START=153 /DNA_END=1415 /DNA_ORIENTATION=+